MSVAFVTSNLIDSTDGKGMLVLDREELAIHGGNAYLPVRIEGEGFRFVNVAFSQSLKTNNNGDGYLRFYIKGNDPACVLQQALADGGADNGITVQVLVEWTDNNGNSGKTDFVYKDGQVVKYAQNWLGNEFRLYVTGMEKVAELKTTVKIVSEASDSATVTIEGETKTLN